MAREATVADPVWGALEHGHPGAPHRVNLALGMCARISAREKFWGIPPLLVISPPLLPRGGGDISPPLELNYTVVLRRFQGIFKMKYT